MGINIALEDIWLPVPRWSWLGAPLYNCHATKVTFILESVPMSTGRTTPFLHGLTVPIARIIYLTAEEKVLWKIKFSGIDPDISSKIKLNDIIDGYSYVLY